MFVNEFSMPPINVTPLRRRLWNDDEMILALDLYFKLPFGKLNHTTPEVIELSHLINRTPSSVAYRLCNYASCDPYIINSGRTGLPGGRDKCMPYWNQYANNKEVLFIIAAQIKARIQKISIEDSLHLEDKDFTGDEREVIIRQRVNQNSFRAMILGNYNHTCAVTGINMPQLLIASHIIPWAHCAEQRLNPENGICLSPLYDKAFDIGLIGVNTDYRIVLSNELRSYCKFDYFEKHFKSVENQPILLPEEHKPNKSFLEYHMEHIFLKD